MAAVAGLTVLVAAAAAAIDYYQRDHTRDMSADLTVRNVTRGERTFASWARATEGEVVEYRATVQNVGSESLSDVVLTFDPPGDRSVYEWPESCWFRSGRNAPRASCRGDWTEHALQVASLEAGDTMTVVVRFRVARPSCRGMLPLTNRVHADSAQTDVTNDARASVHVTDLAEVVPRGCRTLRSRLLYAIPQETRSSCVAWPAGALGVDHVACYPKGRGIQYAVYAVFRDRRSAEAAFRSTRARVTPVSCGSWTSGRGSLNEGERAFRFTCSGRSGGVVEDLSWIEERAHVMGYARTSGVADPEAALRWWRTYG